MRLENQLSADLATAHQMATDALGAARRIRCLATFQKSPNIFQEMADLANQLWKLTNETPTAGESWQRVELQLLAASANDRCAHTEAIGWAASVLAELVPAMEFRSGKRFSAETIGKQWNKIKRGVVNLTSNEALPNQMRAQIARACVAAPPKNDNWSTPQSPAEWGKLFKCDAKTFVRWTKSGKIRANKLTSKAYMVHIDDLPTTVRK